MTEPGGLPIPMLLIGILLMIAGAGVWVYCLAMFDVGAVGGLLIGAALFVAGAVFVGACAKDTP